VLKSVYPGHFIWQIYEGADKSTTPVHDASTKPVDTRAASGKLVVEFTTDAAGSDSDTGFSAKFSIGMCALLSP